MKNLADLKRGLVRLGAQKSEDKVYEYSEGQIKKRFERKVKKINLLETSIGTLRSKAKADLSSKDDKTRLSALAVLLIDHTYERVGNSGSASEGHYGVTTWEVKHLTFPGKKALFTYVGKSGVSHKKEVTDATLVSALKNLKTEAGTGALFKGEEVSVSAEDVNAYLKKYKITAKDIRGYHANRIVKEKLQALTKKPDEADRKIQFKEVTEAAAEEVGHEAATLRTQYLAPSIELDFLSDGKVLKKVEA